MTFAIKSWPRQTYTNGVFADLVAGSATGETVKAISICNTTVADISVSIQVASSAGVAQATVLPPTLITAGASFVLEVDPLNLTASQKLQVSCAAAGIEFYASGVTH